MQTIRLTYHPGFDSLTNWMHLELYADVLTRIQFVAFYRIPMSHDLRNRVVDLSKGNSIDIDDVNRSANSVVLIRTSRSSISTVVFHKEGNDIPELQTLHSRFGDLNAASGVLDFINEQLDENSQRQSKIQAKHEDFWKQVGIFSSFQSMV